MMVGLASLDPPYEVIMRLSQLAACGLALVLQASAFAAENPFAIKVVDEETGRGVPLVELETTNNVVFHTDSNGYAAIDEPSLFGLKTFFHVRSHGYEFAKDGFGYRGKAVEVTPGGEATFKIKRINIAERLYRVTGGGIYRDSVLLGKDVPIEHPLLNAQVFGSDSVVNAVYKGKLRWFWGDTNQVAYPLGSFDVPGAVSELPSEAGLDPEVGVNLTYFVGENGFVRPTADMPGDGPTWIFGCVVLADADGRERMFAEYAKIKPPLETYARGLVEWSDETEHFEKAADVDLNAPIKPGGQPLKHRTDGVEHVYFATPYPLVRTKATPEGYLNLDQYEAFTCLKTGSTLDDPQLDRDADGKLQYSWKRNTPAVDASAQRKLVEQGVMKDGEGLLALRDAASGKPMVAHGGSVFWNGYRKRFVMIFNEGFGKPSFLGEVWYAEADSVVGPWVHAVKIATHDRYDFYNPKQHPYFDKNGGKTLFFEGTYTNTFSGNPVKTPRYDYNQIMYKLELDDPRLTMPVAIYRDARGQLVTDAAGPRGADDIAFFALDRASDDTVQLDGTMHNFLSCAFVIPSASNAASFHVLRPDLENPPAGTLPLYAFLHSATGERRYAIDEHSMPEGFSRQDPPVGFVWPNPLRCTWEATP